MIHIHRHTWLKSTQYYAIKIFNIIYTCNQISSNATFLILLSITCPSSITILSNIISLIYWSHQIFYNIQFESCSSIILRDCIFQKTKHRIISRKYLLLTLSPASFTALNSGKPIGKYSSLIRSLFASRYFPVILEQCGVALSTNI